MKRRSTESTKQILALLQSSKFALSHEMIQEKIPFKIDRATIYRILNRFCEDNIVHKVVGDDGKQYFAFCSDCKDHEHEHEEHNHNHFHFRCTKCKKVECLDDEVTLTLPPNYKLQNFNGIISGLCPECNQLL